MKRILSYSVAAVSAAALLAGPAAAPAAAADFSGKRIEWLIPYGTGGGSNAWARFYAPWLTKALPGQPVIAINNMPGASSTKGTNYFARRGTEDGLSILGTSGSTQFPYLLGDRRVQYDYKDWTPLLATPVGGVVYIHKSLGVKNADEAKNLRKFQLKFGAQGPTSLDLVPLLAFDILGLNVKPVFGMKSRGDGRLAFERGELRLDYQTTPAFLKRVTPLVEKGEAIPLFSFGMLDDNGKLVRDPTFPDMPHLGEVYEKMHGKKPQGPAWKAWMTFFAAGYPAQKLIVIKKGTPKEMVDAWREGVKKMVELPGFKEAAAKALGDYPQAVGKKAEVLYQVATTVDPASRKWVLDWLKRRFNATP
jgi:tripartite-type tricarboxylate transporter receptor subunit TctC